MSPLPRRFRPLSCGVAIALQALSPGPLAAAPGATSPGSADMASDRTRG